MFIPDKPYMVHVTPEYGKPWNGKVVREYADVFVVMPDGVDDPCGTKLVNSGYVVKRVPGFKLVNGRDPEPGRDYDPDSDMCEDDYEYFTSTGRYY